MGETKGRYNEEYPMGTRVRIVARRDLERFLNEWKLHHPLQPDQLKFAGKVATVSEVFFYHGGYELYRLEGIPGIWHEVCLAADQG